MTTDLGKTQPQVHGRVRAATLTGLVFALGFPFYVRYVNRGVQRILASREPDLIHKIGSQLVSDWLVVAVLVVIVLRFERLPLRSIGWKRFERRDLAWVFGLFVPTMLLTVLVQGQNLAEQRSVQDVFSLPQWFRVLLVMTVMVTEEVIFRGYPIERLGSLLGNVWVAGAITWVAFSAGHIPFFGVRTVLFVQAPGALALTILYIRRRSLPAVILLHGLFDLGLILPASVVRG